MIKFDWKIVGKPQYQHIGGRKKVVRMISVRVIATEDDTNIVAAAPVKAHIEYAIELPLPKADAPFVEFKDLEHDTVLSWVKAYLAEDDRVELWEAEAKAKCETEIAELSAKRGTEEFPWDKPKKKK